MIESLVENLDLRVHVYRVSVVCVCEEILSLIFIF